jgi:thymidylate synthase (FAD)
MGPLQGGRQVNVFLIDWMGSDDSVVNAARVSFDKSANNYSPEANKKLINYLAKHKHWSPFAHTCLSFRIKAPIFVARQLAKHQVGLAWNEVSRRYVSVEPEVWRPDGLRQAAENVKQGSSDSYVENDRSIIDFNYVMGVAVRTYEQLLRDGVCPEQARALLPQGMMTEWIWTGSLYAFYRVVSQRLKPEAQKETQEIAHKIDLACYSKFPISWQALTIAELTE